MVEDREITLNSGTLLGIFFGMVVICGLFFGLGYTLGKSSATASANALQPGTAVAAEPAAKPTASRNAAAQNAAAAPADLTFYKAVEKNDADAHLQPKAGQPEAPAASSQPPPAPGSGYIVQVAAVSKQEDAQALVDALRKKQYPVFLASNTGDRFFRVQVGPFADMKEAEAMRQKLVGDGYNAILKK
jgi:DedD protein